MVLYTTGVCQTQISWVWTTNQVPQLLWIVPITTVSRDSVLSGLSGNHIQIRESLRPLQVKGWPFCWPIPLSFRFGPKCVSRWVPGPIISFSHWSRSSIWSRHLLDIPWTDFRRDKVWEKETIVVRRVRFVPNSVLTRHSTDNHWRLRRKVKSLVVNVDTLPPSSTS